jgi:hypothetical protein
VIQGLLLYATYCQYPDIWNSPEAKSPNIPALYLALLLYLPCSSSFTIPLGFFLGDIKTAIALPLGHLLSCFSDTFTKQGVEL